MMLLDMGCEYYGEQTQAADITRQPRRLAAESHSSPYHAQSHLGGVGRGSPGAS